MIRYRVPFKWREAGTQWTPCVLWVTSCLDLSYEEIKARVTAEVESMIEFDREYLDVLFGVIDVEW